MNNLFYVPGPSSGGGTVTAAGITDASANGRSLITAADYAAMRGLLDLEAGTDFLSPSAISADYLAKAGGTLTGQVVTAAGSAAAPAIGIGDSDTGFHSSGTNELGIAAGGAVVGFFNAAGLAISKVGAAASLVVQSESNTTITFGRHTADAFPAEVRLFKSRGAIGTPAALVNGDTTGQYQFGGYGDASTVIYHGAITGVLTQTTPSASAFGFRLRFDGAAVGAASRTEMARIEHATGLSMFGANPVIDENRIHRHRIYTLGTLPTAGTAGRVVGCSDLGGGAGLLYDNGAAWKRLDLDGYSNLGNTTGFTRTVLTNAPVNELSGTLTANQTVTLSTTNAYAGAEFVFLRTGGNTGGPWTWSIGGVTNLSTGEGCRVRYSGSAWKSMGKFTL